MRSATESEAAWPRRGGRSSIRIETSSSLERALASEVTVELSLRIARTESGLTTRYPRLESIERRLSARRGRSRSASGQRWLAEGSTTTMRRRVAASAGCRRMR